MDDNTVINVTPVDNFVPNNPIKYEAVKVLQDNGLRNGEISKALGLTTGRVSQISKELSKNQDLTSNKNVSLASKAHRMILGAFINPDKVQLKSSIKITGSDVTKAIDRSYDRVQPVKRDIETGTSISFIQVNIDGYKCK